jgi:hypothetical protein
MSNLSQRAAMMPVSRRVRAYFAPVDRATSQAAIFDPAKHALFDLDAPPAPWIDLGWVDHFERRSGAAGDVLRAGSPATPLAQFRCTLDARVEFDFREWGKLQMALAGGAQHMNVLAADPSADAQPFGGTPLPPVGVLTGSTASEIMLGAGAVDAFAIGDIVAVDQDYAQQVGYVGAGVAAAYVADPADVLRDPSYVRRVTFNVGRIAAKSATSLLLAQPLIGGPPPEAAGVQKVVAFVDREGGSFFQTWSGLFVYQEESGGRVCFYYPRLSPNIAKDGENAFRREVPVEIAQPTHAIALHASFLALPYSDRNDGEVVLCYRSYFPALAAAIY